MNTMNKNNLFFLISIFALLSASMVSLSLNSEVVNAAIPERLNSYVADNAGIFTPEQKASLEQKLYNLQTITNNVQLVVYTEKAIPADDYLESRSLQIAESNGVGKKGADNGILFYLATDDRKYRWEVGYGMESTLNSALLGRISRDYMVPYFQKGDYAEGINKGIDLVTGVIMNSTDPDVAAVMTESNNSGSTGKEILFYLLINLAPWFIFFIIFTLILAAKRKAMDKKGKKSDGHYIAAASWILLSGGRGRGGMGGLGGGGFSGGGGGFGGGGFSGGF